jgi:hypothetical protein
LNGSSKNAALSGGVFFTTVVPWKLGDRPGVKFEEASLTRPDRSYPVVSGDAADLKLLGANSRTRRDVIPPVLKMCCHFLQPAPVSGGPDN